MAGAPEQAPEQGAGLDQSDQPRRVDAPHAGAGTGRYRPIGDYALIGNAQSGALVAANGAIDWLCLPHFDSPALLCRLLDADRGGYLATEPADGCRHAERRYRPASNVLETTLHGDRGALCLTDAMPVADDDHGDELLDDGWRGRGRHRLVRILQAQQEAQRVHLTARLSFDFTATPARIDLRPGRGAIVSGGGQTLALIWPGELEDAGNGELRGRLHLAPGQRAACALAWAEDATAAEALLGEHDWEDEIARSDAAWRNWSGRVTAEGPYRETLLRSALILKMLTFEPTGALVAAPTTSLPEVIGGVRNWDYRYCWLRDASLTLYALLLVGQRAVAGAFWRWVERICGDEPVEQLQIMYGLHGERDLTERTLDQLAGYQNSRPVRVGNAAYQQRQLDVYGEILDAYWLYAQHGEGSAAGQRPDRELWRLLAAMADEVCAIWREPDRGLWEIRGAPRHYVYSKVMCWVALDRALRLARGRDLPGDTKRWASERAAIHAEVLKRGYNADLGAFTMAYDLKDLDAAALRIPLVGFLPATDPRVRATIAGIERELQRNGLVARYQDHDNLPGREGAFSMCTFWLVECLTQLGRLDDARALFERMLGYANDVGLYSEEIDPKTGAALGNYPQAFTHLALIEAGLDLSEALARRGPVRGDKERRARAVRRGRALRGERGGDGASARDTSVASRQAANGTPA